MTLSALLVAGLAITSTTVPASRGAGMGESVGDAEPMVCVIAPRVESGRTEVDGRGVVMERPSLVVSDPLREVIVERQRGPRLRLHSPGSDLPALIPWQGPSLGAGERVTLRLRPSGSPTGQGATLRLVAAAAPVLADFRREKRLLGTNAAAWLAAIDAHLDRNQAGRAWALLFDPEAPGGDLVQRLRHQVILQGCGDPPLP